MTWELLNSSAFKSLPYAAAKALPYFLGKIKNSFRDPSRFLNDFHFSYPEGRNLGFAKGTFSRVIKDLVRFGFIDPIDKGGLRGFQKGYNVFKLSRRWETYGTDGFKSVDWQTILPKKG